MITPLLHMGELRQSEVRQLAHKNGSPGVFCCLTESLLYNCLGIKAGMVERKRQPYIGLKELPGSRDFSLFPHDLKGDMVKSADSGTRLPAFKYPVSYQACYLTSLCLCSFTRKNGAKINIYFIGSV